MDKAEQLQTVNTISAVQDATSGVWHKHQLFIATPTSVHCIFVSPDPYAPFIEVTAVLVSFVRLLTMSLIRLHDPFCNLQLGTPHIAPAMCAWGSALTFMTLCTTAEHTGVRQRLRFAWPVQQR